MPPRLRDEYVPRADLVDRVLTDDARLVVASGPAGSGKSTLLAQAYADCPDAVWLSVEPIDDDAAVLWSALIDSTASAMPGFGATYRHRLDAGGAEAVEEVGPVHPSPRCAVAGWFAPKRRRRSPSKGCAHARG